MKRLEKRLDLGLSVSISRRSRDPFFKGLGLEKFWRVSVSISSRTENQTSRSRLGLEAQGLVYIPEVNK